MSIWKLPPVLILHFKRFMRTASSPMKIETKIKCPSTLDMAAHLARPCPERGSFYRMCASMHHSGGLAGGHYVAHVLHAPSRKWYLFDDSVVKALPSSGHGSDAYVVFYVRGEPKKAGKPREPCSELPPTAFVPRIVLPVVTLTEGPTKTVRRPKSSSG
jgi:ubiquitin C-terminal hydrolase